jgi:D-3-phosphoglycerate dehydrogenase
MHRIAYLKSSHTLDYERDLLGIWGISDVSVFDVDLDSEGRPTGVALADADGLVVGTATVPAELMETVPSLRVIANMDSDLSNIDVERATARDIYVANVPDFCTYDIALHALGLVIDLFKKVTWQDRQVRSGRWDATAGYETSRPAGKTCGIVGYGPVPKTLAPMLQAIGMDVLVYAPNVSRDYLGERGCTKADHLEDVFCRSDVVSLHCASDLAGRGIVNARTLALMRPEAFLVNTADAALVDEEALAGALASGTIRAAAIDVLQGEGAIGGGAVGLVGTTPQSPLVGLDNCIVTPHAAYLSSESDLEVRRRSFENALAGIRGEVPANAVNA